MDDMGVMLFFCSPHRDGEGDFFVLNLNFIILSVYYNIKAALDVYKNVVDIVINLESENGKNNQKFYW